RRVYGKAAKGLRASGDRRPEIGDRPPDLGLRADLPEAPQRSARAEVEEERRLRRVPRLGRGREARDDREALDAAEPQVAGDARLVAPDEARLEHLEGELAPSGRSRDGPLPVRERRRPSVLDSRG